MEKKNITMYIYIYICYIDGQCSPNDLPTISISIVPRQLVLKRNFPPPPWPRGSRLASSDSWEEERIQMYHPLSHHYIVQGM